MPEMDGFEVIAALKDKVPPAVVFATAYDQFAVKAFEVHAVDYLLKPFDAERLSETLRRVARRLKQGGAPGPKLDGLLNEMKNRPDSSGRLLIKTDKKMVLVPVDDIDWVEAADNYVVLHVGKESHIQRETLSAMETKLPAETFIRISRSTIVNINRIKELQPLFHGEYAVILKTGARLTLTRTYRDGLEKLGLE